LLWESNARVSVDFAAGGGLAIMTAMSMNIKAIAVCLNEPHTKILQKILKKHARAHIEADNNAFVPSDKAARMEKLKSPPLQEAAGCKQARSTGHTADTSDQKGRVGREH